MKNFLLSLFIFGMSIAWINSQAQTTITFEDLSLPTDSFWNGSDASGGFASATATFSNLYNAQYASWGGFAYSSKMDTLTAGYSNMYSAMAGSGHNSATYAVAYVSAYTGATSIKLNGASANKLVDGFYITNNTYAYINMRDGDAYAKKFGGTTGNDSDWFMITISGYNNGTLTDTVNFYLADYRSANNANDYIIKDWTWVDLNKLGNIDSLSFALSSTDNGTYGMNTPAYFCMDDIKCMNGVGIASSISVENLKLYPNPVNNTLNISGTVNNKSPLNIYDMRGVLVYKSNITMGNMNQKIDVSNFSSGMYVLQIVSEDGLSQKQFIKQ